MKSSRKRTAKDATPPEPRRVLQIYDAEKQRQFAHFSAEDKLNWLAAINELYWAAKLRRR